MVTAPGAAAAPAARPRASRGPACRGTREPGRGVALLLEDGTKVPARWDEAQMSEEKLSSVQFLLFPVGAGARPAALVVDHPELAVRADFSPGTRQALAADL